jgi:adenylylsulfate kinase
MFLRYVFSVVVPGSVVWLTGLPGAGKSTIAGLVARQLEADGLPFDWLDGDVVRTGLCHDLGYSHEDRETSIGRIAWLASRLARVGAIVLVSAISPYAEARRRAREVVEEHAPFFEVHVATPLEECIRRDPKGMYRRALAGEIPSFTGIGDPYEEPTAPDLRVDTTSLAPADAAALVLAWLDELPSPRASTAT